VREDLSDAAVASRPAARLLLAGCVTLVLVKVTGIWGGLPGSMTSLIDRFGFEALMGLDALLILSVLSGELRAEVLPSSS